MDTFVEGHAEEIRRVLSCFDRVAITRTLSDLCHADAVARCLSGWDIRLFDYARWCEMS